MTYQSIKVANRRRVARILRLGTFALFALAALVPLAGSARAQSVTPTLTASFPGTSGGCS